MVLQMGIGFGGDEIAMRIASAIVIQMPREEEGK